MTTDLEKNMKSQVTLTTEDGTKIIAFHYAIEHPKAVIVLGGATGVPQGFYQKYAMAANQQGFNVITVDYRGIGQSAPASLKGYKVKYLDWATQDLASAVDFATNQQLPVYLVGHSFGGHALGLLPNAEKIKGAFFCGSGAGWHGWMPKFESLKVRFLWNVLAPILVKAKGYLGWSKMGMGADLPYGVYVDWKRWCKFPNYFFGDPKMQFVHELFARCEMPIYAVNSLDDKWAQPKSRDAFVKGYKNTTVDTLDLDPNSLGIKEIGHMGYFRKDAQKVWQMSFDWFNSL